MMRKRLIVVSLLVAVALGAANQKKLPKPGWPNFFSKEQDVAMGREYAQQIEQQFQVVQNKELTDYVNRIGQRLVKEGGLEEYPFFFKVVNEPSINAFALPGGPMFVHTGLIKAADNEAQIAGVLAHELSHVVLRHGTQQASKSQLIQLPAMIGGAVMGGSLAGQLAQLGIGLGANSVLLKFSRSAESDADLMGAHTMAKAGYNPIEMARFFEKLEAEMGGKGQSAMAQFMSDHPNPGNRVKSIEEQLPYMARGPFEAQEGNLSAIKGMVDRLPAAPKKKSPQQASQQGQGSGASPLPNAPRPKNLPVSATFKTYDSQGFSITYPDNWTPTGSQQNVTLAPKEGMVQSQIGYGAIVSGAAPADGKVDLQRDTRTLIEGMIKQNSNMRQEGESQTANIGGSAALVTKCSSDSPFAGTRETDVVVTIDRGKTLIYLIFISPEADYARMEPVFQEMTRSLRFK
ncbi:MAG: M48 family metalloprotease [Bryobacterales bacterium]|nr:M48 family metalloprotease [Bryobacterales bacterium]